MRSEYLTLLLMVAFGPRDSVQKRSEPGPPKISADSYLNEFDVGTPWTWMKFSDLPVEERDEIFQAVDGGFVFFNVYEVQIFCQAPYPIEWRVNNLRDFPSNQFFPDDIQTYTSRNGSFLGQAPADDWSYTAVLKLYLLDPFVSRNYTCSSATNSNLQSSVFIYLSVGGISLIAETGNSFEINVDEKSVVVLPCRLTTFEDDFQVILQKQSESEDLPFTWDPVTLNDSVVYDSRIGFSLTVKDLPGIVGYFRCIMNSNETDTEDDAVYYRISNTPKKPDEVIDMTPRINIGKGSSALISWEASTNNAYGRAELMYICCSDSKDAPNLVVVRCSNHADCEYTKQSVFGSKARQEAYGKIMSTIEKGYPTPNCSASYVYDPIFTLKCKGEGIDVLETYHYKFKPSNVSMSRYTGGRGIDFDIFYSHHDMELVSSSIPMEVSAENLIKMLYFRSKKVDYGMGQKLTVPDSDMSGRNSDNLYTGTTVTFRCFYSTYIFSYGGYWLVKWKTGDSKMFHDEIRDRSRYAFWEAYKGYLSLTMKLEKELESVTCYCSVLNTSEWKFKKAEVSVTDPVVPSFPVPEEEVAWKLHSKNVSLRCDHSGIPISNKVTWKKDGKVILPRDSKLMRIEAKGERSELVVPEVSHETHGEYSCTVQNIAGEAVKLFNVYVEESDSTEATAWTIFGVSIILVIVGGMTVFVWKYGVNNFKRMFTKLLCA